MPGMHAGLAAVGPPPRRFGPDYFERAVLADGTCVVLRPIIPSDAQLMKEGLRELSERTRYFRFHAPKGELSDEELRFLTEVDGESHFALGALTLPRPRLVAVGRFVRSGVITTSAEIALVVHDAVQGKGLGELVLSRLREAALERGIARFTGTVLEENRPMRSLLRKFGARIGLPSRGVCETELALA